MPTPSQPKTGFRVLDLLTVLTIAAVLYSLLAPHLSQKSSATDGQDRAQSSH